MLTCACGSLIMWHRNAHLERICFLLQFRLNSAHLFLLRLRTEHHHSIPAAVNSSIFGTNAFRPVPARQWVRTASFNDFISFNSNCVRLSAFACLHQQCALLCQCDHSRACAFPLVACEIARAPNARSLERFQGMRLGEPRLVYWANPLPWLDGWWLVRVQTKQSQNHQNQDVLGAAPLTWRFNDELHKAAEPWIHHCFVLWGQGSRVVWVVHPSSTSLIIYDFHMLPA